ncbi:MAG: hypothetical protein ABIP48_00380 [Planctomycetota bacterium]
MVLSQFTAPDRAANIPEFVHPAAGAIKRIREQFVDDNSYRRAGDTLLVHDPDDAVAAAEQALWIAHQAGDHRLAAAIEQHLAVCRQRAQASASDAR